MTKFETVGTQNLAEATTKKEALRAFEWSCRCCCERGMHLQCDHCAIQATYRSTVAILDDQAAYAARKSDHKGEGSSDHKRR